MTGTFTKVFTKRVYLELPPTTIRSWFFSDELDLGAHGHGKESLPETSRLFLFIMNQTKAPYSTALLKPKRK
jgi:hypothetical protein